VFAPSGTYSWSFVTQIYRNGLPSHGGDHKTFEVMTSIKQTRALGSLSSLLAATFYQGNPDRNHKLWNIGSTEKYIYHIMAYAGADGMLLHINGKFTMGKLKLSLFA